MQAFQGLMALLLLELLLYLVCLCSVGSFALLVVWWRRKAVGEDSTNSRGSTFLALVIL